MKEKIHNWWIRNEGSDWLGALLLTCLFAISFLIAFGIVAIANFLCEINIILAAVVVFVLMFFAFLILLKVG